MTEQGRRVAAVWRDPAFANAWSDGDAMSDLLAFPRRLAATLVAYDRPDTRLSSTSAAGRRVPGLLPRGVPRRPRGLVGRVGGDAARARDALAAHRDRVEFRLADMTDLAGGGIPAGADVIVTSRAAHHLDRAGLVRSIARPRGFSRPAAG